MPRGSSDVASISPTRRRPSSRRPWPSSARRAVRTSARPDDAIGPGACGARLWRCPPKPTPVRSASASCGAGSVTSRASATCSRWRSTSPACASLGGAASSSARPVGLEKVEGLLSCDARSRSSARRPIRRSRRSPTRDRSSGLRREYRTADLEGAFLVIAATGDSEVNIAVHRRRRDARDARQRRRRAPLCNFILPAIVARPARDRDLNRGRLTALAKRMKREISEQYGEHYARLAVLLNDARGWPRRRCRPSRSAKEFFESIVNPTDPIALLRAGDEAAVRALIRDASDRALRVTSAPATGHADTERRRPPPG